MMACTRWGVGLSPDSTIYFGAARNLLEGHGLTIISGNDPFSPLAHWPPFLSLVLALPGLIGVDPLDAARWLQVLLFGANAALVGILVRAYSLSVPLGVLAAFLFLTWEVTIEIHSWAWSEPLFISLVMLGFASLSAYLTRFQLRFLIVSGVLIGLALLTRYIGITVIVAASIAIMTLEGRARIRSTLIFGCVSLLPMAIWQVHLHRSGVTSRSFGFHPPTLSFTDTFQLLLPAALALGLALASRRFHTGPAPIWAQRIPSILVRFVVTYVLLFPLPLIFLDASTPVDTRLLFPVYVALLILVMGFVSDLRPWMQERGSRTSVAFLAAGILLAVHLFEAVPLVVKRLDDGAGYASRRWRESETMAHLKTLRSDSMIYSNAQDAVFLLARRPAFTTPSKVDLATGQTRSDLDEELAALVTRIDETGGLVAWFHGVDRFFLASREELVSHLDRDPVHEFSDGVIYEGRSQ